MESPEFENGDEQSTYSFSQLSPYLQGNLRAAVLEDSCILFKSLSPKFDQGSLVPIRDTDTKSFVLKRLGELIGNKQLEDVLTTYGLLPLPNYDVETARIAHSYRPVTPPYSIVDMSSRWEPVVDQVDEVADDDENQLKQLFKSVRILDFEVTTLFNRSSDDVKIFVELFNKIRQLQIQERSKGKSPVNLLELFVTRAVVMARFMSQPIARSTVSLEKKFCTDLYEAISRCIAVTVTSETRAYQLKVSSSQRVELPDECLHRLALMRASMKKKNTGFTFRFAVPSEDNSCLVGDIVSRLQSYVSTREKSPVAYSTLIIGTTGTGKTSLLRNMLKQVAVPESGLSVVVLDTCGELSDPNFNTRVLFLECDAEGLNEGFQQATINHNPSLIFCDEFISNDTSKVLATHATHTPVVTSAHALDIRQFASTTSGRIVFGHVSPPYAMDKKSASVMETLSEICGTEKYYERTDCKKMARDREQLPTFGHLVEMISPTVCRVYNNVAVTVDRLLKLTLLPVSELRFYLPEDKQKQVFVIRTGHIKNAQELLKPFSSGKITHREAQSVYPRSLNEGNYIDIMSIFGEEKFGQAVRAQLPFKIQLRCLPDTFHSRATALLDRLRNEAYDCNLSSEEEGAISSDESETVSVPEGSALNGATSEDSSSKRQRTE